jgi:hypothetical protein
VHLFGHSITWWLSPKTKILEPCSVAIIQVNVRSDHRPLTNISELKHWFIAQPWCSWKPKKISVNLFIVGGSKLTKTSLFIENCSNRQISDRNIGNKEKIFEHVQQRFNSPWQHPFYDPTSSGRCLQSPSIRLLHLFLALERLTSCSAEIIKWY